MKHTKTKKVTVKGWVVEWDALGEYWGKYWVYKSRKRAEKPDVDCEVYPCTLTITYNISRNKGGK